MVKIENEVSASTWVQICHARNFNFVNEPDPILRAFSGLFDLEPLRYSYLQPMIQLDDGIIRRNSPGFLVRPCSTPIWITWGGAETTEFARQSALYHAAWQAAGNRSELRAVPDANHFTVIAGFEDSQSEVCRWLANHLQP